MFHVEVRTQLNTSFVSYEVIIPRNIFLFSHGQPKLGAGDNKTWIEFIFAMGENVS